MPMVSADAIHPFSSDFAHPYYAASGSFRERPKSIVVRGASWAKAKRGAICVGVDVGIKKRSDGWSDRFLCGCGCVVRMDGFVQSWMVGVGRRQLRLTLDSQTYPVLSKIIYSYYVVKSLCRERGKRTIFAVMGSRRLKLEFVGGRRLLKLAGMACWWACLKL